MLGWDFQPNCTQCRTSEQQESFLLTWADAKSTLQLHHSFHSLCDSRDWFRSGQAKDLLNVPLLESVQPAPLVSQWCPWLLFDLTDHCSPRVVTSALCSRGLARRRDSLLSPNLLGRLRAQVYLTALRRAQQSLTRTSIVESMHQPCTPNQLLSGSFTVNAVACLDCHRLCCLRPKIVKEIQWMPFAISLRWVFFGISVW